MTIFRRNFIFILLLFFSWSLIFIIRTSLLGIDGERYFALHDDAMISMRYAHNLSQGDGLVWNPGERVEGYSNFFWTLVMSIFTAVLDKKHAVLGIQILGILISSLIAITSLKISKYIAQSNYPKRGSDSVIAAILISILAYYPLIFWSLMGMETGLLTLLLLLSIYYSFQATSLQKTKILPLVGLLVGLMYLTRPDSLIFGVAIFAYLVNRSFYAAQTRKWITRIGFALAVLVVMLLSLHIFRWLYYGNLFPNTYVLKIEGFPAGVRIKNGLAYIKPFFLEFSIFIVLALIGLIMDFTPNRVLAFGIFFAAILYQIWVGGDAWRNWRMIVPTIPLVIVIGIHEAERLSWSLTSSINHEAWKAYRSRIPIWSLKWADRLLHNSHIMQIILIGVGLLVILISISVDLIGLSDPGFGEEQRILILLGTVITTMGFLSARVITEKDKKAYSGSKLLMTAIVTSAIFLANRKFLPELTFAKRPFGYEWNIQNINRSIAINEVLTEDGSIGVAAAGIIPYYTGRYAIDFLGKMDPVVANLSADVSGGVASGSMVTWPGHNKYDLEYSINKLRPSYAQLLHWGSQDMSYLLDEVYVEMEYEGVSMFLLESSSTIRWDRPQLVPVERTR